MNKRGKEKLKCKQKKRENKTIEYKEKNKMK